MPEIFDRILQALAERMTGPLWLRAIFQPTTAVVFALVDGLGDVRAGRAAFLWSAPGPAHLQAWRHPQAWSDVVRVLFMGMLVDMIYQYIAVDMISFGEALVAAFALAIVPYLLLRGLVTRAGRRPQLSVSPPPSR
jgi:hypothetical protein